MKIYKKCIAKPNHFWAHGDTLAWDNFFAFQREYFRKSITANHDNWRLD